MQHVGRTRLSRKPNWEIWLCPGKTRNILLLKAEKVTHYFCERDGKGKIHLVHTKDYTGRRSMFYQSKHCVMLASESQVYLYEIHTTLTRKNKLKVLVLFLLLPLSPTTQS